ncbi:MAG: RNB domain-containing ribonuclease [Candidatus Eisenbacteria bacterium]|uniref:RNB domain-containing ribonuclease n=1 Tax=Eiseniibacteriota bacterium TaxID=2212470 RepID=A0A538SZI7_UNCEI|nr:MAG: RNB domain-containing ribonuclease [Candidatus Eisenbacteria bacterium]
MRKRTERGQFRGSSAQRVSREGTRKPLANMEARRLLGRAVKTHGRWMFDPARRMRPGIVPLTWKRAHEPEDGDFVIAEITEDDRAFLIEVLGVEDRPAWDDAAVASQFRLRQRFPAAVEHEAEAFSEPGASDLNGRADMREHLVFTIDPEDARDHDDALSIRAHGHGRYAVGIHIADVSHYVAVGSSLDAEAEARGTSCYLPGGVVPMLPEKLSSDLCSLRPDRDRLALSVIADLDTQGVLHGCRFEETMIRSRHRLHYGEVQEALEGKRQLPTSLMHALEHMRALARALRRKRLGSGALDLDVPETKAWVDEQGEPARPACSTACTSRRRPRSSPSWTRCSACSACRASAIRTSRRGRSRACWQHLSIPRTAGSSTGWCCARSPRRVTSSATSATSDSPPASTATSHLRSGATRTSTTTAASGNGSAAGRARPGTR